MDTNFLNLTQYIRTIINCKYTTPVAIISHTINNISCLILNIIDIYLLYMFKTNQPKETMTIEAISKNNVILKVGDKCTFSTLTHDYPNLKLDQKITITEVFDNGVVRVDNGTDFEVNVLANLIDKD